VNLSGTVAQYGRGAGMIEALSQQLLNQFAKNLTALIESETQVQPAADTASTPENNADTRADHQANTQADPQANTHAPAPRPVAAKRPAPPVAPLDAGALVRRAMWQSIRNFFARLFGRKQQN
jgi:hypothetical protein